MGGVCNVDTARSSFDTVDTLAGLDDAMVASSSCCANFPPVGCGEVSIPSIGPEELSASRMVERLIVDGSQAVPDSGSASSSALSTMLSSEEVLQVGILTVSGGQER